MKLERSQLLVSGMVRSLIDQLDDGGWSEWHRLIREGRYEEVISGVRHYDTEDPDRERIEGDYYLTYLSQLADLASWAFGQPSKYTPAVAHNTGTYPHADLIRFCADYALGRDASAITLGSKALPTFTRWLTFTLALAEVGKRAPGLSQEERQKYDELWANSAIEIDRYKLKQVVPSVVRPFVRPRP